VVGAEDAVCGRYGIESRNVKKRAAKARCLTDWRLIPN
jgi:hypothetical protein